MSENNQINNSELFRELSEQEQQNLTAGQNLDFLEGKNDFLFQLTNIQTEANNNLNSGGESGTQNTKYNFLQITLGASITFSLPMMKLAGHKWNNWLNNFLK